MGCPAETVGRRQLCGGYVPDPGLGQMQVGTGIARSDRTELEISRLALPSEGLAQRTQGI